MSGAIQFRSIRSCPFLVAVRLRGLLGASAVVVRPASRMRPTSGAFRVFGAYSYLVGSVLRQVPDGGESGGDVLGSQGERRAHLLFFCAGGVREVIFDEGAGVRGFHPATSRLVFDPLVSATNGGAGIPGLPWSVSVRETVSPVAQFSPELFHLLVVRFGLLAFSKAKALPSTFNVRSRVLFARFRLKLVTRSPFGWREMIKNP